MLNIQMSFHCLFTHLCQEYLLTNALISFPMVHWPPLITLTHVYRQGYGALVQGIVFIVLEQCTLLNTG